MVASGQEVEPGHDALSQLVTMLHLLGGTASRAELTERLGCGRSVMGYLLGDLASRGVVAIEPTAAQGRAGRPSHQVSTAATAPVVIAVHLEIGSATVAVISLGGRITERTELRFRSPADLADLLARLAETMTALAGRQHRVLGAGMAVPSPVRRDDGLAFAMLHMGWPSVPLRDLLAGQLGGIPLVLGNDANLAALAEHRHGAGRGARQLLYLTTGQVGLGGALISNGRLFDGAHGYAMEPGHITVDPAGTPCACGSTGCLEVECDDRGLLRAAGPTHSYAAAAALLRAAASAPSVAHGADRVAEADAAAALRAVQQVTARLGSGLASLINLTDPDRIVLAGSLASYARLAPETLAASLAARSFLSNTALSQTDPVPIVPGELPEAPLLGAADLAFQPFLDDPRTALDAQT
ncbi:MAG TPA: ROK family protein [Streptosporangiaceae bacterium]|nr:ROK family protein [Streptosporangiaceae bacterium]